jgi:hypothetical protein
VAAFLGDEILAYGNDALVPLALPLGEGEVRGVTGLRLGAEDAVWGGCHGGGC